MTHRHEWRISARYYGGDSYAYCIKCMKELGETVLEKTPTLSMEKVEHCLNDYERLKEATEYLSAEDAEHSASLIVDDYEGCHSDIGNWKATVDALHNYAKTLRDG